MFAETDLKILLFAVDYQIFGINFALLLMYLSMFVCVCAYCMLVSLLYV